MRFIASGIAVLVILWWPSKLAESGNAVRRRQRRSDSDVGDLSCFMTDERGLLGICEELDTAKDSTTLDEEMFGMLPRCEGLLKREQGRILKRTSHFPP